MTASPPLPTEPEATLLPALPCSLARRPFLAGAAALAVTTGVLIRPAWPEEADGAPFSDGTFFADDGTGWID